MKSRPRFTHWLFTCLGAGLFLAMGCGEDSLVGAKGGSAIDSSNAEQVQTEVDGQLTRAVFRGPGTYQGAHSGQVTVAPAGAGKAVAAAAAEMVVKMRVELHNYSEDGTLFLDGLVNYETQGRNKAHYQGTLTLSGRYEGQAEVDISVAQGHMKGKYKVGHNNKVKVIIIEIPAVHGTGELEDLSDTFANDTVAVFVRAAVKGLVAQAIAAGAGVHEGAHSGQVKVEVKQENEEEDGEDEDEASTEVEYQLTFENYSEDGEIILDGEVKIVYQTEGEHAACVHVKGELQLSGKYEVRVVVDRALAAALIGMVGKSAIIIRS